MVTEQERLTITVERAGELLGISRPQAYRAVNNGTLPVLRIGRRLVVPKAALNKLLSEVNVIHP